MKREVPPSAIIAIIAAIMLVLGLIGWKYLFPSAPVVDSKAIKVNKDKKDGGP